MVAQHDKLVLFGGYGNSTQLVGADLIVDKDSGKVWTNKLHVYDLQSKGEMT